MYFFLICFAILLFWLIGEGDSTTLPEPEPSAQPQVIGASPLPNEDPLKGAKHSPPPVPPVVQTCLIFKLPNELILHILSHISPTPQHSDHFARFRVQYGMVIDDNHRKRVEFLRPLSKTCKAMRMRLMPWIWERLELYPRGRRDLWSESVGKPGSVMNALQGDMCLANTVNFLTIHFALDEAHIPPFVKCLVTLPNLHTLEIAGFDGSVTDKLKTALLGIELPQVKTLILPAAAHPLLEHCQEVEDVVGVVTSSSVSSDAFLRSLAFNRDSKVRRLAIPLTKWKKPSRFVAVCPKLTELTVIYPLPGPTKKMEHDPLSATVEPACIAMAEIVDACKALPDFDTLQIVYLFRDNSPLRPLLMGSRRECYSSSELKRFFKKEVGFVKDMAISALEPTERKERKGGDESGKVMVRVIELGSDHEFKLAWLFRGSIRSVKIEEYEVG